MGAYSREVNWESTFKRAVNVEYDPLHIKYDAN